MADEILQPGSVTQAGLIVAGPVIGKVAGAGVTLLNKVPVLGADLGAVGSKLDGLAASAGAMVRRAVRETVEEVPDTADVLRGIGGRGVRNESVLTADQEAQLYKHVNELGLDPGDFRISSHFSGYSDNFDVVFLGPNTFPAGLRTTAGVFESMSPRAVVAHEAGHLITTRAGTAFEAGSLYDEVGASLTGRQLPGLNNVERYQLLRDAVERSQLEGRSLRDVISEMQGN